MLNNSKDLRDHTNPVFMDGTHYYYNLQRPQ